MTDIYKDETPIVDGKQYNFKGIRLRGLDETWLTVGTHLQGMLPNMTRNGFYDFCAKWGLKWISEPDNDADYGYDLHTCFLYLDEVDGCLHCVSIYDRGGYFRVGGHGEAAVGIVRAMGLFVD